MAQVKFINTTGNQVDNLSISDGQLIFTSDDAGAFYDAINTRFSISDGLVWNSTPPAGILPQAEQKPDGTYKMALNSSLASYDEESSKLSMNAANADVQGTKLIFS